MTHLTTRNVPVEPAHTALLFIDVQNFCASRDGGEFKGIPPAEFHQRYGWFFEQMERRVVPNMQRLRAGCRAVGIEVMYTLIRNLTRDGRDRSLDYKITGFNVPPDSWDGRMIDALAPGEDEIVLPKTSSNVFVSTNVDYLLRNLGTKYRDFRHCHRSVRGRRGARRLRPWLSRHAHHRCLHHLQRRAAR